MRRAAVVAVAVAVLLGAAAVVWNVYARASVTEVTGLVGSEKEGFFADEAVRGRFAELGYRVQVRGRGSRAITTADTAGLDFAFPSGAPAAEAFRTRHGIDREHRPFFSPMVVLSHRPVAEALQRAEAAAPAGDGTWDLDMSGYLDMARDGIRWRDLPGGAPEGTGRNSVLIRTTDPRTSNSAAMYLAVVSYLLNGEEVVSGPAPDIAERAAPLFLDQGGPPDTSQQPFDSYVALGPGHTPLLWAYESQYVAAGAAGELPTEAAVLYPAPTTVSAHVLLPVTDAGDEVGRLLTEDPELQRLAAEHGFRTGAPEVFADAAAEAGLPVRARLDDTVNAPGHAALEGLIREVERHYAGKPAAGTAG